MTFLPSLLPTRDDLFYPFQQAFDKIFEEFSSEGLNAAKSKAGYPRMDVYQTKDAFVIQASLPGCKPEDVKVEILPDVRQLEDRLTLKLSGQMNEGHQVDDAKYLVRQLRRSYFEQTMILPEIVSGDPVAHMEDGILTLTWKVKPEVVQQPKLIPIKGKKQNEPGQ